MVNFPAPAVALLLLFSAFLSRMATALACALARLAAVACMFARTRRKALQRLTFVMLVALHVGAVPAFAMPFTAADAKVVRSVVEAQLAAFAADDAAKAFSYAAPNVREAVGTPAGFLTMVQRSYPVVYRPGSVAFLKPNGKNDDAIQRVQMTDAAGESWLAIYSLQRQKNKSWRITGCNVVENKNRTA